MCPIDLDPAEVAPLILNYLVAYQVLHRMAKVKPYDKVLLIGASGGVGTAFLQLGKLDNLKMYGLASPSKHAALIELGAIPIDYRSQDFVDSAAPRGTRRSRWRVQRDGRGLSQARPGRAAARRHIGALWRPAEPVALRAVSGASSSGSTWCRTARPFWATAPIASISGCLRKTGSSLFNLLEAGQIKPIIAAKFPILEAAQGE